MVGGAPRQRHRAVGFALARHRRDFWQWFIPLMLLYVPVVLVVSNLTGFKGLIIPESGEYVWRPAAIPAAVSTPLFAMLVVFFFVYTMLLFVPPGQLTGRLMVGLPPLSAYMVNILGSLGVSGHSRRCPTCSSRPGYGSGWD